MWCTQSYEHRRCRGATAPRRWAHGDSRCTRIPLIIVSASYRLSLGVSWLHSRPVSQSFSHSGQAHSFVLLCVEPEDQEHRPLRACASPAAARLRRTEGPARFLPLLETRLGPDCASTLSRARTSISAHMTLLRDVWPAKPPAIPRSVTRARRSKVSRDGHASSTMFD